MKKVEVKAEERAERIKKYVERYTSTPWQGFTIDQVSVWALWATIAVSVFLYCTVTAVTLAVR